MNPLPLNPSFSDGRLLPLLEIESPNIDTARRRWLRPRLTQNNKDLGPIVLGDGANIRVPFDDENAPEPPAGALSLHRPFSSFESLPDSVGFPGYGGRALGRRAPQGKDGEPGAPTP